MKRNVVCIGLVLALTLALAPLPSAAYEEDPTIVCSFEPVAVTDARRGDIVEVKVAFSEHDNFDMMEWQLSFDPDKLKAVDVKKGDFFGIFNYRIEEDTVLAACVSVMEDAVTTVCATVFFEVLGQVGDRAELGLNYNAWYNGDGQFYTGDSIVLGTGDITKPALGDAIGDGKVNAADAAYVLLAAVGKVKLDEVQKQAADANGDGTVNALDATQILRIIVGNP